MHSIPVDPAHACVAASRSFARGFALLTCRSALLALLLLAWLHGDAAAQTLFNPAIPSISGDTAEPAPAAGSPSRLRQATQPANEDRVAVPPAAPAEVPYVPGEFERYVQSKEIALTRIRRLGAELVTGDGRGAELSSLVPADYLVSPGDEVLITLWGAVDADLRLVVDRGGRISVPRVGSIQVAGVRHADLPDVVNRRVAQVFVGSSRVDLQACKLEYSIVSPK